VKTWVWSFFIFIFILFICAYNVWVISPPLPPPPPLPPGFDPCATQKRMHCSENRFVFFKS
jgi:hypothetical protein